MQYKYFPCADQISSVMMDPCGGAADSIPNRTCTKITEHNESQSPSCFFFFFFDRLVPGVL